MITDKLLLRIAFITAIIGFFGLFFFQPVNDADLLKITVFEANNRPDGTFIKFKMNKTFSGFVEGNLSEGKYLITGEPGGNDFYYISSFKKVNGSN